MAQKENKPVKKNTAASELGKLGGLKGGKARAASLSAEQRSTIASAGGKASASSLTAEQRRDRAINASHSRRLFKKK